MIYNFENKFINVLEQIYKDKYNFSDELKYFHKLLESQLISDEEKILNNQIKIIGNDRNSIFYNDYHQFIDNNDIFNKVYHKFINDYIKPLFLDEDKIVIQKTPNLRISFPNTTAIGKHIYENENDNVIGLHKDSDFGHHEDEINIIIPITNMFETNSIYYEPEINSNISTDYFINLKLKTNEFFVDKFNKKLHFNKINKTQVTRLSLDFRIIPFHKYIKNINFFKGTKFDLDNYYIIL